MSDGGNALLGSFPAVSTERIGGYVDVRASKILMCEPGEVTRRKRSLQLDDSLNHHAARDFTS